MTTAIQIRRGTTAQFTAANPVLRAGEPSVDLTTGSLRIGDGSTAWASLPSVQALALAGLTSLSGAAASTDIIKAKVTGDSFDRFILNADGTIEVGYGTLAPERLIDFGASFSSLNFAIGRGALNPANTGTRNTAVGKDVLKVNTTGSTNTGLGSSALGANTTGFSNAALGAECLSLNTTGNSNTAAGARALKVNVDGYRNTAIGNVALGANISGYDNVAVGDSALGAQTTTFNNTAVGNSAGAELDPFQPTGISGAAGADNTCLGLLALGKSVHGIYNIAVGIEAGRQLSSRGRRVASGATTNGSAVFTAAGAAFANDTAQNAGDVGRSIVGPGIPAGTTILSVDSATQVTMSANATATASGLTVDIACDLDGSNQPKGSYNIAVGRYALDKPLGVPANGTTTGNHNIGIGQQTGFMSRTQRDNTISIGAGAGVDGDNAMALGHNARAGALGAAAIGCDSLGNGATTTTQDEIKVGTSLQTANFGGDLPLKFGSASAFQTTVGAAGGGAALPATPTKYLKVKDSAGTTFVIPMYAAA